MKWFLAVSLLLGCAKLSVGNSLRRTNNGGSHITTTSESDSLKGSSLTQQLKTASERWSEVECLAGSEWVGNCHSCLCSDRGRAICTKLENCKESHDEPLRCKPQSVFKRDCNTCRCLDNGLGLCTMRGCPKASPAAVTEKAELPSGMLCAVGSRWTSRCNECVCSADGEPECSNEDCPGKENEPESQCAEGSVWKNDCNTCWCSRGRADCTKIGCSQHVVLDWNPTITEGANKLEPELEKDSHNIQKRSRCEPNSVFQKDCNRCVCGADGTNYACTLKLCLSDIDEIKPPGKSVSRRRRKRSICKPNSQFRIYCNDCACAPDGQSYSCTAKDCADDPSFDDDVEVFKEQEGPEEIERHSVCKPRGIFYMGCNTCKCNIDGSNYACTNKPCPLPEDVEIFHELKTTTTTPIPINIEDIGMRFKRSSTQKACQPGQEFRMDCNKCLCDNEGQNFSCTRIDCAAINNGNGGDRAKREVTSQNQTDCAPGSVFEQGCNVCRCTSDGNHATCTMKSCQENPDNDINVPESDPSFRCNPGEQFKRGCKDCTCSADGRSVFCTLRLCDQDINPSL